MKDQDCGEEERGRYARGWKMRRYLEFSRTGGDKSMGCE